MQSYLFNPDAPLTWPTAAAYLPPARDLKSLQLAAEGCRGCPLYCHARHLVFGEGPENARIMLVGEQPGEREDARGLPFCGPAGIVLDNALLQAGLSREEVYITSTVKHFKHEEKEGRRVCRSLSEAEIHACFPWLQAQIHAIAPQVIVCLGRVSLRLLTGYKGSLREIHGRPLRTSFVPWLLATYHPAAVLHARGKRAEMIKLLASDLYRARELGRNPEPRFEMAR